MNKRLLLLFVVSGWFIASSASQADIIMSVQSGGPFQNTSTLSLNVVARATTASETLFGLVADFRLPDGGIFTPVPGTFMQPGMIGAGSTGVSLFDRGASPFNTASLSLDFSPAQLMPTADQLIATLSIDPTGLVPGVYRVTFDNVEASNSTLPNSPGFGVAGTFEIAAIPEPTSLSLVASFAIIGLATTRRRRFASV